MKRKRRQSIKRPISILELKRMIARWTEEGLYKLEMRRALDMRNIQTAARDEIQISFMREFVTRFGCGTQRIKDGEMEYEITVQSIKQTVRRANG